MCETKLCVTCGAEIERKSYHNDHNWASLKKCDWCSKNYASYKNKGVPIPTEEPGNRLWQALRFGELTGKLATIYERKKKKIRNLRRVHKRELLN